MDKVKRMKELVTLLNKASDYYYNTGNPIMTDSEYDKLYDVLVELEKDSLYKLPNTPTMNVGYEVKSKLNKVQHEIPLKSLGKTKDINELKKFIGSQEVVIMLKMDGLTNKLTYDNYGKLTQGSTRGNGILGEEITHSVQKYKNVPEYMQGHGNVVGEAIIKQGEFKNINSKLTQDQQYKNSRNLVAGTIRSLDSKVTAQRNVRFYAFGTQGFDFKTKEEELLYLENQGFDIAPYKVADRHNIETFITELREYAQENGFPIDGLVITYNDILYGLSKGETSHHPLHSMAFKFGDSEEETTLIDVEWSVGRTGVITPTCVFEPVELEGTIVERASVHNVSIFKSLQLGYFDTVVSYKANQIIPQIKENLTRSNTIEIPKYCPSCNHETSIKADGEAEFLICENPNCNAKTVQKFSHFCSRDAMNVLGVSEAILETFIDKGFIKTIPDLYSLEQFKSQIVKLSGFGLKSYNKIIESINSSKKCKPENFLFALGIPNIGRGTARDIMKYFNGSIDKFMEAIGDWFDFSKIDDIGEITNKSIYDWLANDDNLNLLLKLLDILEFETEQPKEIYTSSTIQGLTFVVTGDVYKFKNRKELEAKILELGGKLTGSVSKNTNYLLNNDINSPSSKNQKAKQLNIPIITEDQFLEMIK